MTKASNASQARELTDIPNIGKSIAQDLRAIGVNTPVDVKTMNPMAIYEALRKPMGRRHDPCVLDTFLAAKDFMNGGPALPWWHFTPIRKAQQLIPE